MKKFLSLLLVAVMLLTCLASCGKDGEDEGLDTTDTEAPETEVPPAVLDIILNGQGNYTVIYPNGEENDIYMKLSIELRNAIKNKVGVLLQMSDDFMREGETADANALEILVGRTNRAESAKALEGLEGYSDYSVSVVGNKLVFAGRNDEAISNAIYWFINKFLTSLDQASIDSKTLKFSEEHNYMYNAKYPLSNLTLLGSLIGEYTLVVPANAGNKELRFANSFAFFMNTMTGSQLSVINDTEAKGDKEIYVGKTSKTTTSVGEYEYAVSVKGNCVEMVADSLYGFEEMQTYVQQLLTSGAYKGEDKKNCGEIKRQNISETLSDGKELVINKTGELRIMYHNIWGWNESATNPTPQRNKFLYDTYLEYNPDILCLQEVTHQMRLNKEFPLISKLCEQGYAEVEVEQIKNLYTATPILYRTDVVKLVDKGVIKFGYEVDKAENPNLANSGGQDKFITWAVFERLDASGNGTGVKMGVISVHLAYQSGTDGENYRMAQVPLVVDTAKNIMTKHECAVMIGGDMNCTTVSNPYKKYIELGFTDVWTAMEGSENRDDGKTNYGYPTFNPDTQMFDRNITSAEGSYATNAIDHVFYIGNNSFTFKTFDIITDNYVMCGSDHTPLLIDFDLKKMEYVSYSGSEYSKNY